MFPLRRIVFILVFFGVLLVPAFGANISFWVIETGINEEGAISETSYLWESGMLDVFFEAGHIVSNAPVHRVTGDEAAILEEGYFIETSREYEEALEYGADFFIAVFLDYGAEDGLLLRKPRTALLQIYKMTPETIIFEGTLKSPGVEDGMNTAKEFAFIKEAVKSIVSRIKG